MPRLQALLDHLSDAFVVFDRQWRYIYINQAAQKLLGRSPEDLLGKNVWTEVFPLEVGGVAYRALHQAMETQKPVSWEEFGEPLQRWLEIKAYPDVDGIALYFCDITERKQAETELYRTTQTLEKRVAERTAQLQDANQTLQEYQTHFQLALHAAHMIGWRINLKTQEVTWSANPEMSFGFPPGSFGATVEEMMSLIHPEDQERTAQVLEQVLRGEAPYELEFRLLHPDGKSIWVYDQGKVEWDERGHPVSLTGISWNITDRKRMESALKTSQTQLQQQLAELEAIYQLAPIGLAVFDPDLRFLRINERLAEINGFPVEAHLGRTVRELLPGLIDQAEQVLRPILKTGEPLLNVEIVGETPAQPGVQRIWLEHFFPIKSGDQIIGISTVCEEITERKRAELALKASEERYALLTQMAPVAIFRFDARGHCVYVNDRWSDFTGLPTEAAMGMGWVQTLHPEDRDRLQTAWVQWSQSLTPERYQIEGRCLRPDGRVIWYYCQALPEIAPDGSLLGYVGTLTDISERKQFEESLRQEEERYRYIFDAAGVSIWEEDFSVVKAVIEQLKTQGVHDFRAYLVDHPDLVQQMVGLVRIIDVNEMSLQMFGVQDKQELLTSLHRIFLPETLDAFIEQLVAIAEHCPFLHIETVLQTLQGNPFHVLLSITFPPPTASFTRVLVSLLDISDRKRLEATQAALLQQEMKARQVAEQANRIKDEFLTVLSHELRSPLNPILGWANLLQTRQFTPEKTTQALGIIANNAKLLAQLIEDLLDVARILRGKMTLEVTQVHLPELIKTTLETVKLAAETKGISVTPVLDTFLPSIAGDPTRLQQAIWNLLTNAIKFTPAGGQVEVYLQQVESHAQIQVIDTGKGIALEFLPHVFEYFRQEDGSTTRQFGGLGLGLTITREVIEMHGGTIHADSAGEGQGATFTVLLPLPEAQIISLDETADDTVEAISSSYPRGTISPATPPLAARRIIVIDDDADTRDYLVTLLETEQAIVMAVDSASQALIHLIPFQPDLVLCDIAMPDMDGYSLIREIRRSPVTQIYRVPAIALTAYVSPADQEKALKAGFNRHVAKPVSPQDLLGAIAQVMEEASLLQ